MKTVHINVLKATPAVTVIGGTFDFADGASHGATALLWHRRPWRHPESGGDVQLHGQRVHYLRSDFHAARRLRHLLATASFAGNPTTRADRTASRSPSLPTPRLRIRRSSAPPPSSLSPTADFVFASSETGSTFACSLTAVSRSVHEPEELPRTDERKSQFSGERDRCLEHGPDTGQLRVDDRCRYRLSGPLLAPTMRSLLQGAVPEAPLIWGGDGFSTDDSRGGPVFSGTVFRIDPAGGYRMLSSFSGNAQPLGRLIRATDGKFYGTTRFDGPTAPDQFTGSTRPGI